MRAEMASVLEGMTLEQKSSQVLMTGIYGKERFAPSLMRHFDGVVPGAVLLFGFNIADTPRGLARYLDSCNRAFSALGAPVPVLFAVDHEGGEVYRTGRLTTRLPSARDVASGLSPDRAEALYRASGAQLALLGIGMNLAPVAETLTEANSSFLGSRSFSASGEKVSLYAAAAVKGYRSGGVLTVLKHFPGNGAGDPHSGLPSLDASARDFETDYIGPFRGLIRLEPDAVLVSHIVVPALDPGVPFCLSEAGVQGLLRKKLGFGGLVLTDDISMGAIARNGLSSAGTAVLALRAGCDMVMTSDPDIRSVAEGIRKEALADNAFARRLDEAVVRIFEAKLRAGLVKTARESYSDSRAAQATKERFIFNQTAFSEARAAGDRILEELDGN